jgi:hypothetical protein
MSEKLFLSAALLLGFAASSSADIHTVRVSEYYIRCDDGSTNVQYIELKPYFINQFFRQCASIQVKRTVGGPDLFFAKPVLVGHGNGDAWTTTQNFLLATPSFQAKTGIVPDLLIPDGILDPAGGVIRFAADSGCEPNTNWGTIHEVRYGDQGTAPIPGPHQAANFVSGSASYVLGSPTPRNFAGATTSTWTCVPPPDVTPPTVTVLQPNGGEMWLEGTLQPIQWNASDDVGIDHFDLYYTNNLAQPESEGDWIPIAAGIANVGQFDWMIPSPDSTGENSALVIVVATDAADNAGSDASDAPFIYHSVSGAPYPDTGSRPLLFQNRPNPFFGAGTQIGFVLPGAAPVRIDVFSVAGRLVRVLSDGMKDAGYSQVFWDGRDDRGRDVPGGVYFYVLESGPAREVRRMILQR